MAGSPIGYVINHSLDILVIDQQGRLLESKIKPATSAEDIVAYVRRQLDENQ
jgi:cytochrome oxidase Cu insertion factor (SCO1/SenC/PrrC family)